MLVIASLLAFAASIGVAVYHLFPATAVDLIKKALAASAGMRLEVLHLDGYAIPYYRGGSGPPLLLLHGFADNKLAFLQACRWLGRHHTVYLPDLPGHGDTTRDAQRKYGVTAHVSTFKKFADALGLEHFSIGGNSLGGHIAAAFALAYPGCVEKLLLLDAAGLKVDEATLYSDVAEPMNTEARYERFMASVFVNPPFTPAPMKKLLIAEAEANFPWLNRMLADLRSDSDYLLGERIREIKAPTLILWGEGDRILPVAHAAAWHAGIAGSTLILLPDCGHAPEYEKPEETARLMLDFLADRGVNR